MRELKKISTAEVEADLMADADNVDAWDALIKVPASNLPRPAWYRRNETPVGMTLADCGDEVDAQELYLFIASHVTGVTAYELRPRSLAAAGLDFYLVLGAVASVSSIANVLWMAYDRFIAPKKHRMRSSAGIYVAVRQPDGSVIDVRLEESVSKQDFVRRFEIVIAQAKQPELQFAHEKRIRELEESDSWVKIGGNNER
jgi:hypothetical protein